jgi:hypothetical protein
LACFAAGLRDAARIFARDAHTPTVNELHDEIKRLHNAADQQQCEVLANLVEQLSPAGRDMLAAHGVSTELPTPAALRDPALREAACAAVAQLCQHGGRHIETSPRNAFQNVSPYLHAPEKQRNFPKRGAERDFVMWLQCVWAEATGKMPAVTARHGSGVGPFARFARECLRLVGAPDVDVVELMNGLHRRRREMKPPTGKRTGK